MICSSITSTIDDALRNSSFGPSLQLSRLQLPLPIPIPIPIPILPCPPPPLLHLRPHHLPRRAHTRLEIEIPDPPLPLVQVSAEAAHIVPNVRIPQLVRVARRATGRDEALRPRPPRRVVRPERVLDLRRALDDAEQLGQHVRVLERHAGAGALVRRARVRGVAQQTHPAPEVRVGGRVVEQGPQVGLLHEAQHALDLAAPAGKVALHLLPPHRQHPPLALRPRTMRTAAERHDVHRLALLDRERQHVAPVPEIHLAVAREVVAQHGGRFVHRDQAAVRVLARVHGARRGGGVVGATEQQDADAALDAVAADHGVRLGRAAVRERQPHAARLGRPRQRLDVLAERGALRRHERDELGEEVRAVDAALARARGDGRVEILAGLSSSSSSSAVRTLSNVHAPAEIKPDLLLVGRCVLGAAAVVAVQDAGVDEVHGAHGVRAEGDAGTDLGEGGRGLVDVDAYVRVAAEEADGEGEAADAAAADGDGDWGFG